MTRSFTVTARRGGHCTFRQSHVADFNLSALLRSLAMNGYENIGFAEERNPMREFVDDMTATDERRQAFCMLVLVSCLALFALCAITGWGVKVVEVLTK